jgi:hypothetical protein
MSLEWTYSYYKQRALIIDGPFVVTEIICTVPYMTELLRHTTLEDIAALKQKKLTPSDLVPFFNGTGARANGN